MTVVVPSPDDPALSKTNRALDLIGKGRSNATGVVSLTAGQTTTVVSAPNCAADSVIQLTAKTANAAGALATTYVSAVANGSFTLTHANAGTTDRTFGWVALG